MISCPVVVDELALKVDADDRLQNLKWWEQLSIVGSASEDQRPLEQNFLGFTNYDVSVMC